MDLDMLDTGHRVLVLHPLDSAQEQTERAMWSWLPGTVLGRLGAGVQSKRREGPGSSDTE